MSDNILFFDIETKPNIDALNNAPDFSAPSNYKDPEKIDDYIQAKLSAWEEKAALDPDYGYISSISTVIGFEDYPAALMSTVLTEDAVIRKYWEIYDMATGYCGFNVISFDFPYLLRRSMALGIKLPTHFDHVLQTNVFDPIDLRRYRSWPVIDLMQILYNWSPNAKGLKKVCEIYGIDNPLPQLDGSQVGEMDTETEEAYVNNDVGMVRELYKLMKGVYF